MSVKEFFELTINDIEKLIEPHTFSLCVYLTGFNDRVIKKGTFGVRRYSGPTCSSDLFGHAFYCSYRGCRKIVIFVDPFGKIVVITLFYTFKPPTNLLHLDKESKLKDIITDALNKSVSAKD